MSRAYRAFHLCWLVTLALAFTLPGPAQNTSPGHIIDLPATKDTVVRFFYLPSVNWYFHIPLLFRVVDENDARLKTAPALYEGRTAYITVPEMQQILVELSHLNLSWEESSGPQTLETSTTVRCLHGGACVKVVTPTGAAEAKIGADKICQTLAPLDAALKTPRALWEFQFWRVQYQCKVPSFNPDAYPDRIP